MVQTYNAYSTMESSTCVTEFGALAASMATAALASLLEIFIPQLAILFHAFWPMENYIDWGITKLDGLYHCAAVGGEDGFSLVDGVWDKQLNYIEQNVAQVKAMAIIPYYGFYIKVTNILALKAAFEALV